MLAVLLRRSIVACLCCIGAGLTVSAANAQSPALPPGSVTGVVTATGANGEIIKAANVMVQLWTTDATTEAKRDTACAMWLANKTVWLQAKGEIESPSGVNWTGTAVGNDIALLNSLIALRRDTVHTDANGAFSFASVPFGAYTVEAELYANEKFLQWSADAAVIPNTMAHVRLDQATLAENQYCTLASAAGDTARIYEADQLDHPLRPVAGPEGPNYLPSFQQSTAAATTLVYVVNEKGVPDPQSVRVTLGDVSIADARKLVEVLRFEPPTVHGVPVRVHAEMRLGRAVTKIYK